jgi:predicted nucleic acid-binding protein
MIVVVESNFVLELALGQEEAAEAEFIVALAACNVIRLVIPGCALFEPFETLVRRRKARNKLVNSLEYEVNQLSRSHAFSRLRTTSEPTIHALSKSTDVEASGLDLAIRRLIGTAAVIPLSDQIMSAALDAKQRFQLEPQDAVVFASVDQFLREQSAGTKVFANRNADDFETDDIKTHFEKHDCRLISKFAEAVQFLEERGSTLH